MMVVKAQSYDELKYVQSRSLQNQEDDKERLKEERIV